MGFFSFLTQDTNQSIANIHSRFKCFTVYMFDNKGNVWKESNYDGYGEFGSKDFYELFAEMNGFTTRDEGIALQAPPEWRNQFNPEMVLPKNVLYPNLARWQHWKWINQKPIQCSGQGYFEAIGHETENVLQEHEQEQDSKLKQEEKEKKNEILQYSIELVTDVINMETTVLNRNNRKRKQDQENDQDREEGPRPKRQKI